VRVWTRVPLTYGVAEHGESPEGRDGLCQVLLSIVQLLDVPTYLLHHHLALLRLSPNVVDFAKQFLYGRVRTLQILPAG
jgi:hypothetical protein